MPLCCSFLTLSCDRSAHSNFGTRAGHPRAVDAQQVCVRCIDHGQRSGVPVQDWDDRTFDLMRASVSSPFCDTRASTT